MASFISTGCENQVLGNGYWQKFIKRVFKPQKKRGKTRTKKPKWAAPLFSATSRKNPWTWQGTSFFPNWFLQLNSGWFLATVAGSVLLQKILSTMYYPSAEQRKRKATKGDKKREPCTIKLCWRLLNYTMYFLKISRLRGLFRSRYHLFPPFVFPFLFF